MKNLIKLSILVLTILFLFVGCREEHSRSGAVGLAVGSSDSSSTPVVSVPEPATLFLLGSGVLGLLGLRRRFRK